jgi:DNA polymerase-3 subunit gamma/tau
LLDQAIAYTGGSVTAEGVQAMLGTVDRGRIEALLAALAAGDGAALMAAVDALALYSPDFGQVLDDLAVAPAPRAAAAAGAGVRSGFAAGGARGTRRVGVARTRAGLVPAGHHRPPRYRPGAERARRVRDDAVADAGVPPGRGTAGSGACAGGGARCHRCARGPARCESDIHSELPKQGFAAEAAPTRNTAAPVANPAPTAANHRLADAEDWLALQSSLGLRGPVRELAAHTAFLGYADGVLRLALAPGSDHLRSESLVRQLGQQLANGLGSAPQIRFEAAPSAVDTLHERTSASAASARAAPRRRSSPTRW